MLARAHIRSLEQSLALRQAAIEVLSGRPAAVDDLLRREKSASDAFLQEIASARALLPAGGNQAGNGVLLGRLQVRLETVADLRTRYDAARADFLAALDRRDPNGIRTALEDLDALREEQNTHLEDTRREALSFASAAVESTQESGREVIRLTLVTLALAILLGFLGAFWIARRMVTSIRRLVAATEAVEQGRYDAELPVTSKDEIGRLTRSFNLMIAELRLKEKIRATFGRYLDPQVVSGLIDGPEAPATGGERRSMTILFADMAGFSHLSEEVSPGLLVTVLNRFLAALTHAVRDRKGVLDKYLGDGAMAFWGPPFVDSDAQARLACEAALLQMSRFAAFREELPDLLGVKRFRPVLGLRIGIASGDVIAGNVGSQEAMNYTVLGDPVNIAARLEKLNKRYGTSILVCEATAALLDSDAVLREVDRVAVSGREGALSVYELAAMAGETNATRDMLFADYATGLAAYRRRDWAAAAAAFRSCLAITPGDGPATTMLARCDRLQAHPPPDDWDGTWRAGEG
jgi:adenylate cyclase